jgi:hypothetical protein
MALIDELKERRNQKEEVLDEVAEAIKKREEYRLRVEQELDDLDLAIAALQPGEVMITVTNDEPDLAARIVNTDEGWELEPALIDEPDDASEFAESDDEATRAAAIELTADVPPEPEFIELDQETCEPVQPQWNEPQTEGYAPVTNPEAHIEAVEAERYAQPTNPEADFWSRGLAPSEPEKKHRFSIFGHKRETEDA